MKCVPFKLCFKNNVLEVMAVSDSRPMPKVNKCRRADRFDLRNTAAFTFFTVTGDLIV